jgi:hypothetical protein
MSDSSTKIALKLMIATPEVPEKQPVMKGPSVDERIEYAAECLECGHNKQASLEFLQHLYHYICKLPRPKKGDLKRKEFIRTIIEQYGILPDLLEKGY